MNFKISWIIVNRLLKGTEFHSDNFIYSASKDDWSDSQCIPYIRTASNALVKEIEQEFPQLELLSDFTFDVTKVVWGKVNIIVDQEFLIDFKEFVAKQAVAHNDNSVIGQYLIDSITQTSDGNMVVSGTAPDNYSHITVINSKGKIQKQDQMTRDTKSTAHVIVVTYPSIRSSRFVHPMKSVFTMFVMVHTTGSTSMML
ncbi:hypothetical protein BSL78_12904 [Apostichopus japonicus]|uniref:Uncharacterized protein n=1 Tax=Stichopus japonicus TaxID=307972 RepID=A0A2G8KQF8_STIJA|nr:hypothetical protein BSL78_12904 [Apostichopus japonicus]